MNISEAKHIAGRPAGRWAIKACGRRTVTMLAVLLPTAAVSNPPNSAANQDSHPLDHHINALVRDLHTIAEANYLHLEKTLQWRVEQSYDRGETACVGDTSQHQELEPVRPKAGLLWDKHVRRRFNLADLARIVVKPGAKPDLYSIPAKFVSGSREAYTVTISTKAEAIEIEYHGFDGGRIIAREAPLFFSTYYHNLFVITRSKANDVAARLRALAEECGAGRVQVDDLTR